MNIKIALLLSFAVIRVYQLEAQDQPRQKINVEIEKKDDTVLKGKILSIRKDTAVFQDYNGQIQRIAMKEIRNIEYVDTLRGRSHRWFESPNTMRYLLTATAFPLKKNQVILASTYIAINSVHYGISDKISVGGGGDIFTKSVGFLNLKTNIINNRTHRLSAGLTYYRLPSDFIETYSGESVRNMGMITAASTWGNANNHFTIGAGYTYIVKGFLPPIVTLGGTKRIAKNFALVTENWFLFVGQRTGIPVIVSLGMRYLSKRSSLDLAFFSDHKSVSQGAVIPYLAYSIKLGK
jgi:hypothetical protein